LFQELKSDNENPNLPIVDSEKENIVEPGEKYFGSTLSETKKSEINEKLLDLLNKEKIFMQKGISLEKVATLLEVNSKYVSQVINENFYVSFPVLLNDYRIKEAIKMLSDSQYAHYSIEGIANSVGFNSKSVFNNTFKKATGVTPSYFKNNIRNIVEKSA
jgi:AraC-like DNA-binding protein